MAETDESQKTEEPTQKKLDDAHKQGQVPKSQEVRHWFMLTGITLSVSIFAIQSVSAFSDLLVLIFDQLESIPVDDGRYMQALFGGLMQRVLGILAMPFLVLVIAAIAGNMVQHKPVWTMEKMKPKWNKISPLAGVKRLFSMQALMEFTKSLLKIIVVGIIVFMLVWPERELLSEVVSYDARDVLSVVFTLAVRMMGGVVAAMTLIAGADFLFQRFQFLKQQRMSHQEIKDEHKQLEGDPMVKARLRQIRADKARQRMMASVPDATVVITNPTHYAIALKYKPEEMDAPVLVAKGVDAVALRIRVVADDNDIPIIENPPLARALFASVDIDDIIPTEHYKAVAEVIGFVLKLSKRGRRPRSSPTGQGPSTTRH